MSNTRTHNASQSQQLGLSTLCMHLQPRKSFMADNRHHSLQLFALETSE